MLVFALGAKAKENDKAAWKRRCAQLVLEQRVFKYKEPPAGAFVPRVNFELGFEEACELMDTEPA